MHKASSATGWARNQDGALGWIWNPLSGCLNHTPEGLCLGGMFPCYAFKLANGRLKERYLANDNFSKVRLVSNGELNKGELDRALADPFYPRFWPKRIEQLIESATTPYYALQRPKHQKRKGVFVCDMGELFGDWIPYEWQRQVFKTIRYRSDYRFYLLTKQPQSLLRWSPFPPNCWVGVTATDVLTFTNACILLGDVKASIKYLSLEPLLAWGDFPANVEAISQWAKGLRLYGINQIIIGAQTKPYKPPQIEWVEEIVRAADRAGAKVFLKDNLMPLVESAFGRENYLSPILTPDGELRQELPKVGDGSRS